MSQPDVIDADVDDQVDNQVDSGRAGAEIIPYRPAQIARAVDMRSASTDSWTDVVAEVAKLADFIAGTDFVPKDLRGKPAAVAAAILYGREIGLPPMTALEGIAMIEGRPSLYAETIRAQILAAGHELVIQEKSASKCVILGRRKGETEWHMVTWTMEDARRANLLRPSKSGKPSGWQTYPRAMLLARATTELARDKFADVTHGMRSAEELMDELDTVVGYQPPAEPPQPTTTVQRAAKNAPTKRAEPQTGDPGRTAGADDPGHLNTEPKQPPPRKRAPKPAKKTAAKTAAKTSPGAREATTGRAGHDLDRPEPGPSIEQQQEEIRHLSEERRDLMGPGQVAADRPAAPEGDPADQPSAEDGAGRATGPQLTASQRASIMMHFARLNLATDRDERLLWTNLLLGYPPDTITSANDLRQPEAQQLLTRLETFKDRDALDGWLTQDQLPEPREDTPDE